MDADGNERMRKERIEGMRMKKAPFNVSVEGSRYIFAILKAPNRERVVNMNICQPEG